MLHHPLRRVLLAGLAAIVLIPATVGAEPPSGGAGKRDKSKVDDTAIKSDLSSLRVEPKPLPVPNLPVVKTTDLGAGLIAEDLKVGGGDEIKPGNVVVAHYHGTFKSADGEVHEFDSSYKRGEPVSLPLSAVIPGWQKGVPGMRVGGIRRLLIPSTLAYGEKGAGEAIPPNTDLTFILQIIDVLRVEDITVGDGEAVGSNPLCVTAYTMKTADGKVIESATRERPFVWVPGEFMGMSFGMDGMKVGGKRRIVIPATMNIAPPPPQPSMKNETKDEKKAAAASPNPAITRPANVPLIVEVELISVRNNALPNMPDKGC